MCVLYYYEYLLMEKLKEGLVLLEKPLTSETETNPNFENVVDGDKCPDKTQNSIKYLTMLIISVNSKECNKISSQLSYQRCKKNFGPGKSIIVYYKNDYKLEYKKISSDLWFLDMALEKHPWRLLAFLNSEMNNLGKPPLNAGTTFARYLQLNSIVEVYLDNIGSQTDKLVVLPPELFRCKSIKVLSLMNNCLTTLSADIGRMENLEHLVLTNNKLTVKSIPHTLRFCLKLTHLYLDKNHLDALPGMLLDMKQLLVVRRHGNSNYFKSTFIWYHTDVNDRVLKVSNEKCRKVQTIFQPETLEMLAIQSIIASKENFFRPGFLPEVMQEQISRLYMQFNVCGFCNTAKPKCEQGYKVFTFKYPYLGNTCVPFQHWTCSRECGEAIEVPARAAQKQAARRMDHEYQQYIASIQLKHRCLRADKSQCLIL
ncbi:hypothetical protein LSTR_LSTR007367 [Laodelphax striatellus]|uniref:Uncharacterized protein n=1 Tax=Laodelphax striatellus TaxID=195883 RepID=A0A482XPK0_LAOST|nr:hypothetical protein LSTR_LSTR007367 [Laodelphax striatellus]